ncbi:MAG: hypothetical protein AABZ74_10965 [Cyanobacteriota bacterium]
MTGIIAVVVSIFMLVGGILPHYSNKIFEDNLKEAFNSSKIIVKTYKSPSYSMLAGDFERIEINANKSRIMNIDFDNLKMVGQDIKIDYSKLTPETNSLDFIKKGKADLQIILSAETVAKIADIPSLTLKLNNMLSNLKIPLPIMSGEISVDQVSLVFENNKPTIKGNLISLGGFITIPFSFSFDLVVTAKNTLEIYKPQLIVMNEPLIIEQIQDFVKYVNPILDIKQINKTGKDIQLKNLYFKDNKLKIIAVVLVK